MTNSTTTTTFTTILTTSIGNLTTTITTTTSITSAKQNILVSHKNPIFPKKRSFQNDGIDLAHDLDLDIDLAIDLQLNHNSNNNTNIVTGLNNPVASNMMPQTSNIMAGYQPLTLPPRINRKLPLYQTRGLPACVASTICIRPSFRQRAMVATVDDINDIYGAMHLQSTTTESKTIMATLMAATNSTIQTAYPLQEQNPTTTIIQSMPPTIMSSRIDQTDPLSEQAAVVAAVIPPKPITQLISAARMSCRGSSKLLNYVNWKWVK